MVSFKLHSISTKKKQRKTTEFLKSSSTTTTTTTTTQALIKASDFYTEQVDVIPADIYQELNRASGRCKKSQEATNIGLSNSLCSILVKEKGNQKTVGMVRLVGNGGTFCAVVGLCVLPIFRIIIDSGVKNSNNNNSDESNSKITTNKSNTKEEHILERLLLQKLQEYINDNIPNTCYIAIIASKRSKQTYEEFGFVHQKTVNRFGMFLKK